MGRIGATLAIPGALAQSPGALAFSRGIGWINLSPPFGMLRRQHHDAFISYDVDESGLLSKEELLRVGRESRLTTMQVV